MPVVDPNKNDMSRIFDEFSPMRIKYKDIFDLKEFYKAVHDWLEERDWTSYDDDFDHWETMYIERIGREGLKEHFIRWRLRKKPSGTDQILYFMDIDMHTLAISNTEIVRGGQKIKANKGEIDFYVRPYYQTLYKKGFRDNKILKFFLPIFANRYYNIPQWINELYHEAYSLNNFVKQWFKLKRFMPYEETESFYPSLAYPSHMKEK